MLLQDLGRIIARICGDERWIRIPTLRGGKVKPRQHEASRVNNEATRHMFRKGVLTKVEEEFGGVERGRLDIRATGGEVVQVRVDDIGEVGQDSGENDLLI